MDRRDFLKAAALASAGNLLDRKDAAAQAPASIRAAIRVQAPDSIKTRLAARELKTGLLLLNPASAVVIATARGRVGFLPTEMLLLYVTGGAAWASVEANVNATIAGFGIVAETRDRFGWTVGVGGEYAFGGGWSAKAEYLYVKLDGSQYFNHAPVGFSIRNDVPLDNHIFRVGVNYKFGGSPVVAKY